MSKWAEVAANTYQVGSLNLARLESFAELDDDPHVVSGDSLLIAVIDLYLSESPATADALKRAGSSRDQISAHKLAHNLKSSSANIGADQLSQTLQAIEDATEPGGTATKLDATLIDRALDEFTKVCRDLRVIKHLALGLDGPAPV